MSRRALRSGTADQPPPQAGRLKRITNIHDLDMKHQSLVHQSDILVKDEEAQRLKARMDQLRDENLILRNKAEHKDVVIHDQSEELGQLRDGIETAKETSRRQEKELKERAREMSRLEAELSCLKDMVTDSSNVLAEKLALFRELDSLKPEVEHIRTQLSQQKKVISDKLALERKVDSLEAELAAEKRSRQQVRAREDAKVIEELQQQFDESERQLAAEKRAREKVQRDGDRTLSEARAEIETLQERVETVKTKLKSAQAELKMCRAELASAQQQQAVPASRSDGRLKASRVVAAAAAATASSSSLSSSTAVAAAAATAAGRKRHAADISADDITLQTTIMTMTPDQADGRGKRPLKKKGLLEHYLVGEKSMFSITPFLSRSRVIGDESTLPETDSPSEIRPSEPTKSLEPVPSLLPVEEEDPVADKASEPTNSPTASQKGKPAKEPKPRGRPRIIKPLTESVTEKNLPTAAASGKKGVRKPAAGKLENVLEEESEGGSGLGQDQENATATIEPAESAASGKAAIVDPAVAEGKKGKKKRKLLTGASKTIIDDDGEEAEDAAAGLGAAVGGSTAVEASKGGGGRAAPRKLAKTHLGPAKAAAAAFRSGGFSPLKRDRRGMNASFLA